MFVIVRYVAQSDDATPTPTLHRALFAALLFASRDSHAKRGELVRGTGRRSVGNMNVLFDC